MAGRKPQTDDPISPTDAMDLVRRLREWLFLETDEETGEEVWNPDREINGADLTEYVVDIFHHYNMVPQVQEQG